MVLIALMAALFGLAFLTKRRYGVLGLGLAGGLVLSQQISKDFGAFLQALDVPVEPIVDALYALVKKARGVIKQSVRTAEDVLNAYVGEYYGQFIVIKKVEQKILAAWGDDGVVDKSITKSKVLGRVEHEMLQPGYREFFLEEQLLRKHCVSMSFGYDEFKAQLRSEEHTSELQSH